MWGSGLSLAMRISVTALVAIVATLGCADLKRLAYEAAGRDTWQLPDRVVAELGIQPGNVVADLGSGTGYFTGRLAAAVGPSGRVYAVDVDDAVNRALAERMREEGHANVVVVLAEPEDPKLPEGSVDLVFSSNTYHHLEDRAVYFRRLKRDLASGGRVAIIEYRPDAGTFQKLFGHGTEPKLIRSELEAAGYRKIDAHGFLELQSFQVFEPVAPAASAR